MIHKHRIVPGYDGGEYTEENVVKLTPIQHAMWHYAEWVRKGDYRDFCAYKMILGDVNNPEFRSARSSIGGKANWEKNRDSLMKQLPEKLRKANKAQRDSLKKQGKTIAEKEWVVTDPEGNEFTVSNLAKFCRENDLLNSKMSQVASGKRRTHKGWKVRRA